MSPRSPSFNGSGVKEITTGGMENYAGQFIIEESGKITGTYISGSPTYQYYVSLFRSLPDGTPDVSFGGDGYVEYNICGTICTALSLRKINNLYYVIAYEAGTNFVTLLRLEADGDLDPTMPVRKFDPDPNANYGIRAVELKFDGTYLYALYQTDWQYEPADDTDYVLCKFDLDGNSVLAFGGTGCLVIYANNSKTTTLALLTIDDSTNSLFLSGFKNNVPVVTKLDRTTGAIVSGFGTDGNLFLSDYSRIVGLELHADLGLMTCGEYLDGGKKTYAIDLYKAQDGSKPQENRLKERFVGSVHATADFIPDNWIVKGQTIFVNGMLQDGAATVLNQKLKFND